MERNLISYFIHLYMNESLPLENDAMSSTALNTSDQGPLFPTKDGGYYQYKNLSNYIVRIIERTEVTFCERTN